MIARKKINNKFAKQCGTDYCGNIRSVPLLYIATDTFVSCRVFASSDSEKISESTTNSDPTSIFQTRKMLLLRGMFLKTSPPESSLRQLLSSCGTVFKLSGYSTLVMFVREMRNPSGLTGLHVRVSLVKGLGLF